MKLGLSSDNYDIVVIGGGPAGIAAAKTCAEAGLKVVIVESTERLGGIPLQCIHPGFGLHYFKEDLTGPEFVYKLLCKLNELDVDILLESYVADLTFVSPYHKEVRVVCTNGIHHIKTPVIIYTTGARERHIYEIGITGSRVSGIYTAGEAQALMDIYGVMPGKRILIIGSGDVGLIMARRFALEGASVIAVVEIMPFPGGLTRNVVQCLEDFDIPLLLSHAVIEVNGDNRVRTVKVAKVDEKFNPIAGTEREIECDTVVIAAGLVPYTRLLEKMGIEIDPYTKGPVVNEYYETTAPGIFVAGNVLIINDLVDYVVEQGEWAAKSAIRYLDIGGLPTHHWKKVIRGDNVRLIAPHFVSGENEVLMYFRVMKVLRNATITFTEINKRKRVPVVKPAEMERIKLTLKDLSKLEGDTLTVSVKGG